MLAPRQMLERNRGKAQQPLSLNTPGTAAALARRRIANAVHGVEKNAPAEEVRKRGEPLRICGEHGMLYVRMCSFISRDWTRGRIPFASGPCGRRDVVGDFHPEYVRAFYAQWNCCLKTWAWIDALIGVYSCAECCAVAENQLQEVRKTEAKFYSDLPRSHEQYRRLLEFEASLESEVVAWKIIQVLATLRSDESRRNVSPFDAIEVFLSGLEYSCSWTIDRVIDRVIDCLIGHLIDWLIDWLAGWLAGYLKSIFSAIQCLSIDGCFRRIASIHSWRNGLQNNLWSWKLKPWSQS